MIITTIAGKVNMSIPNQPKHNRDFMDILFKNLVQDSTYTNVQMANYLFSGKEWSVKYDKTELRLRMGFHSGDGVEHRVDISGSESVTELSAILKRADINTYVLFFAKRVAESDYWDDEIDFWEITLCFKRAPNTWHISIVF